MNELVPSELGPRSPLNPSVMAQLRRQANDVAQFAWDAEANPKPMLDALSKAARGSVLLPIARFMEATVQRARIATGGRGGVDQGMILATLKSSARFLHNGRIDAAVDFLLPVRRLLTPKGSVEEIRKMLADVIRDLYPAAPRTYTVPAGFVPPAPPQLGMSLQPLTADELEGETDELPADL